MSTTNYYKALAEWDESSYTISIYKEMPSGRKKCVFAAYVKNGVVNQRDALWFYKFHKLCAIIKRARKKHYPNKWKIHKITEEEFGEIKIELL